MVKGFLKGRGLELSEEKTPITHIEDGFDFLGWNFRKYKGKLLIKPSKKAIDKATRKISDVIKIPNATHGTKLLPDTERVMKCLSGMKGNFHVPF